VDERERAVNTAALVFTRRSRDDPGGAVETRFVSCRVAILGRMAPTAAEPAGVPEPASRDPLLRAAIELVPPSTTAFELDQRLRAAGVAPVPGLATALLDDLAGLGLVRVSRRDGEHRRYVPTTLGTRTLEAGQRGDVGVALHELEQLRTDLLSTIAHELRTPLTAVRTSVGLLLDPSSAPTDEQRTTLLTAIERNADRMQRLVGDILELSRFRSGSVQLQLRRFRAVALAESAVTVVAPLATGAGQRIVLDAAIPAEHQVFGDRRRLEQALVNLVANAQRYSPPAGEVRLRVERRGAHTAWIVEDDGPGIPEADRPRLFERFFVGRNDRSGPRDGVGLGLPTSLAIAQAHGGTIEVDSTVGQGSRFALVVPTSGPEEDEP
jgi:signal transduction histidine kinase